jgi:phosphate transport system protein
LNAPSHFEESLRQAIERIRTKVKEMAGLAEQALTQSLQALLSEDRQRAYSVILRDQYIDELETELDQLCLEFMVRQQPVANPLRFVFTTVKLNKELERIGDYAESIARQVLQIASLGAVPVPDRYRELGQLAIHMFHDSVQAFVEQDAELARRTMAIEDRADSLRNAINTELMKLRESDQLPLEALTPALTVARRFERVTDQSKNICEEVLYMCTGQMVKHQGSDNFRILFVDDTCSYLAPLAEAAAKQLELPRFVFQAAGMAPTKLDPEAVRFLVSRGLNTAGLECRALDQIPGREHFQIVVALSPEAQRALPTHPSKSVGLFWPVAERVSSAEASGSCPDRYATAFEYVRAHLRDLLEALRGNPTAPKATSS